MKTNNINETSKVSQFLNTTYSGTTNIPETKNNTNSGNKNKHDSKNNEIKLDNNDNIDTDSTSTYTHNNNSNSNNGHIQKYKQGGKLIHTGEIHSKYTSGSCKTSISQEITKKTEKRYKYIQRHEKYSKHQYKKYENTVPKK